MASLSCLIPSLILKEKREQNSLGKLKLVAQLVAQVHSLFGYNQVLMVKLVQKKMGWILLSSTSVHTPAVKMR